MRGGLRGVFARNRPGEVKVALPSHMSFRASPAEGSTPNTTRHALSRQPPTHSDIPTRHSKRAGLSHDCMAEPFTSLRHAATPLPVQAENARVNELSSA